MNIKNDKDNGKKNFQPKCINWSYRYLGKIARIQINSKQKKITFILNHIWAGNKIKGIIGNQPPQKNNVIKKHIKIIFAVSAI